MLSMVTRVNNREELPELITGAVKGNPGKVGVKVHFGRTKKPGSCIDPRYFQRLKEEHNIEFFDTNTLYGGERGNTREHLKVAAKHGFKPAKILDETELEEVGPNAYLPRGIFDYDLILNVAHLTGHKIVGYGGCIKNIAMGMVAAKSKLWIHDAGRLRFYKNKCKGCGWCEGCDHLSPAGIKRSCNRCGGCIGSCPAAGFSFGKQAEVAKRLVEVAKEVAGALNIVHVLVADNPTKLCDCMGDATDKPLKKVFFAAASEDLVEIERIAADEVFKGKDGYKLTKAQVDYLQKLSR